LTLGRKKAAMTSQTRNRQDQREQGEAARSAGPPPGVALVPLPYEDFDLWSCLSGRPFWHQVTAEGAEPGEAEEVLVADLRGDLTPSQVVQARFAALLRAGDLEPLGEAGRLSDSRRRPVE
jgi:hypothetical protein